jgi:hypothetical protein
MMPENGRRGTVILEHNPREVVMSTTEGADGIAQQSAPRLLGSEVREGYADVGDARLQYVEAGEGPSHWVHHDEAERVTQLLTGFIAH